MGFRSYLPDFLIDSPESSKKEKNGQSVKIARFSSESVFPPRGFFSLPPLLRFSMRRRRRDETSTRSGALKSEARLQDLNDRRVIKRRDCGAEVTEPSLRDVIRHFVEMSVIDPEVLKGLRDADRPEEFRSLFDRFLRVRFHAVRGVEPEDIHAILRGEARQPRGSLSANTPSSAG